MVKKVSEESFDTITSKLQSFNENSCGKETCTIIFFNVVTRKTVNLSGISKLQSESILKPINKIM